MKEQKRKVGRPRKEESKKLEDKTQEAPKKDLPANGQVPVMVIQMETEVRKPHALAGKMVLWWVLGLLTGYLIGLMFNVNITVL